MIDSETQKRVVVNDGGTGGPYIMVPLDQSAHIGEILKSGGVSFWVDSDAISVDGKPFIIVINLGRGADAERAQRLLDSAA